MPNTINLIEEISSLIITNTQEKDVFIQQIKNKIRNYINKLGGFEGLRSLIHTLSYNVKNQRRAMLAVFKTMEYDFCEKFSLSTDSFYRLWFTGKNKNFNLDHWFPQNLFKDKENDLEYQQIGNIILLEETLNKSKQDNIKLNTDCYKQSRFYQTFLLNKENRGELNNNQIDIINKNFSIERFSPIEINDPTLENIRKRSIAYEKFFIKFIKEFIEL